MKAGGPHRKLQLLGSTQTLTVNSSDIVAGPAGAGGGQSTLESTQKVGNRSKNNSLGGGATPTPSASLTLTSAGRSKTTIVDSRGGSKSPAKRQEAMISPRTSNSANQMKSSVSQNQLTYSVILTGNAQNKSFQPVLKKVEQAATPKTGAGSNTHMRKSGGSFTSLLLDKTGGGGGGGTVKQSGKLGNGGVVIKEQPFNYEERHAAKGSQKSADSLLAKSVGLKQMITEQAMNDVSKKLLNQYESSTKKAIDKDVHIVEVGFNPPHPREQCEDSGDEVRMRPSEEISINQDQLLFAFGSAFSHSRIDSGSYSNLPGKQFEAAATPLVKDHSYRAFIEEHKGDLKIIEHENQPGANISEKFEVIREDSGKDSFYSPARPFDNHHKHNSDMKNFNTGEDDYYNNVSATGGDSKWNQGRQNVVQHTLSEDEQQFLTCNTDNQMKPNNFGEHIRQTSDRHEEMRVEDLEDTPKNIKDRASTNIFANQVFNQYGNQKLFMQSLNFPDINQHDQQAQFLNNENQAHVLSFSEEINGGGMIRPTSTELLANQKDDKISGEGDNAVLSQLAALQPSTAANAIIEMEKNYVIMQYESLLNQLSVEFQKVLAKTNETDEHLASQELLIQTQQKIIQEKEAQQFQQEQVNSQLSNQVQDLLQELEQLTMEKTHRQQIGETENEKNAAEREFLENALNNFESKVRLHESNEICLRDQVDQSMNKLRIAEQRLRQKEEELFVQMRESQSLIRDITNLRDVETSFKLEIQRNHTARMALEDQIQEMKQRATQDQILLRVRENELESVSREFKALKGAFDTLQVSFSQTMRENDQLKANLSDQERAIIQMKGHFQTKDVQTAQLEQDIQRLKAIIEKERQRSNTVEEDYKRKIEAMQGEIRDMQQRKDLEIVALKQQYESRLQAAAAASRDVIQPQIQQQTQYKISEHRNSVQRMETAPESRSQAPWNMSQQQSVVPQVQTHYRGEDEYSDVNKYTKKGLNSNANTTLLDYHQWEQKQGAIQGVSTAQNYRSLERTGPLAQNNAVNFNQPRPSTAGYMNQVPPQSYQENQFSPRGQGLKNLSFHEEHPLQAAGKKSNAEISPFAVTQEQQQRQIKDLQNKLSAMQIDKEKFENEYRKLGTSKNKQQIEKKKDLELEIDVVNKNIHQIKQRLREMNAL